MSSLLTSQGLVLATAMAVSAGTVILFDLLRDRYFPGILNNNQDESIPDPKLVLISCLSSGNRKFSDTGQHQTEKNKKKKKKRVQFADDVKGSNGNGESMDRKPSYGNENERAFGDECYKMPANRLALYSGILRDRVTRMEYN